MKKIKTILINLDEKETTGWICVVLLLFSIFFFGHLATKDMTHITNDTIKIEQFTSNPSRYCNSKKYFIAELPDGKYGYLTPDGTLCGVYDTPQEAQKGINNDIKKNYDMWIKSKY